MIHDQDKDEPIEAADSKRFPARRAALRQQCHVAGRVNLLYRLSPETPGYQVGPSIDVAVAHVLPFVSRSDHLFFRAEWYRGRWVRLTWTPEQKAAILRQDAVFCSSDLEWSKRHQPVDGATVVPFPPRSKAPSLTFGD